MKYIIIGLLFAVSYGVNMTPEILAAFVALLSTIYYGLVFRVMAGLNGSTIGETDRSKLQNITLNTITNIIACFALIVNTPYAFIGYIALPWVTTTTLMTILGWAIHFKLVILTSTTDKKD